jgi:hypothetical protein
MNNNDHIGTQGEFRGDFTRDTFDPSKHFSRVLMQQGRVQLDADWNEQTSILLHYLQALAADLIGPHGGPANNWGFQIIKDDTLKNDFRIGTGRYYVDGILCENDFHDPDSKSTAIAYSAQPDYPLPKKDGKPDLLGQGTYLAYLDVWERHVTYVEDEDKDRNDPSIREAALNGPDTATRAKVVWQVRVKTADNLGAANIKKDYDAFRNALGASIRPGTGLLKARARKAASDDDACCISPESRYRGPENQLYRIEIHKSGPAWDGTLGSDGKPAGNVANAANFKWSRDNALVVFPIRKLVISSDGGTTVSLESLGRDALHSLKEGDWVEIVDDDYILENRNEPLLQVDTIDRDGNEVTLKGTTTSQVGQDSAKHPLLRRWDHKGGDPKSGGLTIDDGAALLQEGSDDKAWLNLENGVQIQFPPQQSSSSYRTGDYWLIPARVATGDVEWPGPVENPVSLPPHGIQHYYAPLWIISVDSSGKVTANANDDCRRKFGAFAS